MAKETITVSVVANGMLVETLRYCDTVRHVFTDPDDLGRFVAEWAKGQMPCVAAPKKCTCPRDGRRIYPLPDGRIGCWSCAAVVD